MSSEAKDVITVDPRTPRVGKLLKTADPPSACKAVHSCTSFPALNTGSAPPEDLKAADLIPTPVTSEVHTNVPALKTGNVPPSDLKAADMFPTPATSKAKDVGAVDPCPPPPDVKATDLSLTRSAPEAKKPR